MAYHRRATHWHVTTDHKGRRVEYITSDECTVAVAALVSIHDPHSDLPSHRLVRDPETGWRRRDLDPDVDAPYPAMGLIVYGISKFDRPDLAEAATLDRTATDAIKATANA